MGDRIVNYPVRFTFRHDYPPGYVHVPQPKSELTLEREEAKRWEADRQPDEVLRWASWYLNPGETRLVVHQLDTDMVRFEFSGPMDLCADDARSLGYKLEEESWD